MMEKMLVEPSVVDANRIWRTDVGKREAGRASTFHRL